MTCLLGDMLQKSKRHHGINLMSFPSAHVSFYQLGL